MAAKKAAKRLGKKHRQASTRPKKGRAPKSSATTGATRIGAVDPKKRKEAAAKRISRRSPDFETYLQKYEGTVLEVDATVAAA